MQRAHTGREREFLIRAKVMWVSIINTYIKVYSSSGTEITLTDIALVAESWPTMKLLKLETKWPKSAHQTTEHFISGNPSGFFLFFFSLRSQPQSFDMKFMIQVHNHNINMIKQFENKNSAHVFVSTQVSCEILCSSVCFSMHKHMPNCFKCTYTVSLTF